MNTFKFQLRQHVWFMHSNKVRQGFVFGRACQQVDQPSRSTRAASLRHLHNRDDSWAGENELKYGVTVRPESKFDEEFEINVDEALLFPTKEALIASL